MMGSKNNKGDKTMPECPKPENKFPKLLTEYRKEKNKKNFEVIEDINQNIFIEADKIPIRIDEYGKKTASSTFTNWISPTNPTRPENPVQRAAIIRTLKKKYIGTLFDNGQEVTKYLTNVYNYAVKYLEEIRDKNFFTDDVNILTAGTLEEKILYTKYQFIAPVANFVLSIINFSEAFDYFMSSSKLFTGSVSSEELSSASLIMFFHEALTTGKMALEKSLQTKKTHISLGKGIPEGNMRITKEIIKEFAKSDIKVLDSIIETAKKNKSQFLVSINRTNFPSGNPLSQDKGNNELKYNNIYIRMAAEVNNLSTSEHENESVLNAAFKVLNFLLNSISETYYQTSFISATKTSDGYIIWNLD